MFIRWSDSFFKESSAYKLVDVLKILAWKIFEKLEKYCFGAVRSWGLSSFEGLTLCSLSKERNPTVFPKLLYNMSNRRLSVPKPWFILLDISHRNEMFKLELILSWTLSLDSTEREKHFRVINFPQGKLTLCRYFFI